MVRNKTPQRACSTLVQDGTTPMVGRFMAVDSVGVKEADLHSFNRYAFVNNNPHKYIDPDGRETVAITVGSAWGIFSNPGAGAATAESLVLINPLTVGIGLLLMPGNIGHTNPCETGDMCGFPHVRPVEHHPSIPISNVGEMLGVNGTQTASSTVWKAKNSKARIDVENPNLGVRPGQIHYQDAKNNKYYYDLQKNQFTVGNSTTLAPKSVQELLKDASFMNGIQKARKVLGSNMLKKYHNYLMREMMSNASLSKILPTELLAFIENGLFYNGFIYLWRSLQSTEHATQLISSGNQHQEIDLSYKEWSYNRVHIDDYTDEDSVFGVAFLSMDAVFAQWVNQFPDLPCLIVLSLQLPDDDLGCMASLTFHCIRNHDLVFDIKGIENCPQPMLAYIYTPESL